MIETPQAVLRRSVAVLAAKSHYVTLREDRLEAYLDEVARRDEQKRHDPAPHVKACPDDRIAFVLLRDAANFGSGWHPFLNKEPGLSGARTTGVRLSRWLAVNGVPSPEALRAMTAEDCATVFGQSLDAPVGELMALFAEAWRQLGTAVVERYGGSYGELIAAAHGSALKLSQLLGEIGFFGDVYELEGQAFPFLKRAQLAAYDLSLFCGDDPRCQWNDLDQLTIFADNLVPHTLKIDGILDFAPSLEAQISAGMLIRAGSPEEIEIRAMAVHATERLAALCTERGDRIIPLRLSDWLWNRGQSPRYKAHLRQRTRSVHY